MQSARFRRPVAAVLVVTLTPWISGCYHEVRVRAAAAAPLVGKKVRVESATTFSASVVANDGARSVMSEVRSADGMLISANSDSVRLRDALLWHIDRSQSLGVAEAAIPVTAALTVTQIKLDPARSALAVTGGAMVVVVIVTIAAVVVALAAIIGSDARPTPP